MKAAGEKLDGVAALRDHLLEKAALARSRCGGVVDADGLIRLLQDRQVVRHRTELVFDGNLLEPGEFAQAMPRGEGRSTGYRLVVHPALEQRPEQLLLALAYPLVRINYGRRVSDDEALLFGAALLGLSTDEYHQKLCELADGPCAAPCSAGATGGV